ncbi:MAG: hypothetical protein AAF587_24145 [Bacteroidota bacterium]
MTETVYTSPLGHSPSLNIRLKPEKKWVWRVLVAAVLFVNISYDHVGTLDHLQINGQDGRIVIARKGTVVNAYAELITNPTAGSTHMSVSQYDWKAGDLLLILQRETKQNRAFADSIQYEFVRVASAVCGELELQQALRFAYERATSQVIRIPQYHTLRIKAGGELRSADWNGKTGGVIAIAADSLITVSQGARMTVEGLGESGDGGIIFLLSPQLLGRGEIDASGLDKPEVPYHLPDEVSLPAFAGRVEVWGERVQDLTIRTEGKGEGIISLPKTSLAACTGAGKKIFEESPPLPYGPMPGSNTSN